MEMVMVEGDVLADSTVMVDAEAVVRLAARTSVRMEAPVAVLARVMASMMVGIVAEDREEEVHGEAVLKAFKMTTRMEVRPEGVVVHRADTREMVAMARAKAGTRTGEGMTAALVEMAKADTRTGDGMMVRVVDKVATRDQEETVMDKGMDKEVEVAKEDREVTTAVGEISRTTEAVKVAALEILLQPTAVACE